MPYPQLLSHHLVWFDPPDANGDEQLHVVSERRSMTFKGIGFREFCEQVVPLLDGQHALTSIAASVADDIDRADLDDMIALLVQHGVVIDLPAQAPAVPSGRTPQANLFADLAPGEPLQERLAAATVAVIGAGGPGPATALALAAAGVGTVRCCDHLPVALSDVYFSPYLGRDAVGRPRSAVLAEAIRSAMSDVDAVSDETRLDSVDDVATAIAGADYVVACLDTRQANLAYKINRACLDSRTPWLTAALAGAEVIIGPGVRPGTSACYTCYRMRTVATAGNPTTAFAYERQLDRRREDDSARRENLCVAAGIAGNLLANEVIKEISGLAAGSLVGRILSLRLTDLEIRRHTVLRKPGCPDCFPDQRTP